VKVLSAMYSEVQDLTAISMNNRNLHHIRTVTKQMRYILNIIHHSFPDFEFDKISIETLREIELAAGNWHDKLVRIESLEKCINKMKFTDESEKYKFQKLYNACKSELDISFSETSEMVRKAIQIQDKEL
jgi:CHAD domain-containing protein